MQRSLVPGLYSIVDLDAGPKDKSVYIGSTDYLDRRVTDHSYMLNKNKHHNYALQRAFNAGHQLELTVVPLELGVEVLVEEQKLLDKYFPTGKLFNIAVDATAPMKGRTASEETREKLRNAVRPTRTKEHSEALSKSLTGRTLSDETKAKLSAVKTGVAVPSLVGRPRPDAVKEAIRQARSIPVTCKGVNYPSTKAAAQALGVCERTAAKWIASGKQD